jgi:hypothetical protein
MTPNEFTAKLPPLSDDPLPIKPPFIFNNLSTRVFPLRASLDSLQRLCDGYLNFVPPEAGRFRAYMPYVFLMVLDYSQIGEAVMRVGWFAQFEVFFSVPVEWYKLVNGNWVFHDWAVFTPYIFVDDSFSVPLGRIVYGFPKILAKVTSASSGWVRDPAAPVTLAKVETSVFPETYSGRQLEMRKFLEIRRAAPMSNFQVPADPLSPMMPWVMASNVAQAFGGFARDALWMAQAQRLFPISPLTYPGIAPQMLARMAPALSPSGPGFIQNSLNLKQFRRSDDPELACYQAVTNGQMRTTGFNGAGLLGEERTFLGDASGGLAIQICQYQSLPIARTLGLEVHRSWRSGDVEVAELKPVMPFWMSIDMIYDEGTSIAWRGPDGIWKSETGTTFPSAGSLKTSPGPLFNSSVASVSEAIAGPFQFSGATVRVLPLLAHRSKMQEYLNLFINEAIEEPMRAADGKQEEVRLTVWARPKAQVNPGHEIGGDLAYVYLTATSFTEVTSKTNNVGDWAKYELSFLIPVKWERKVNGVWTVAGVGAVPAYTFIDNCIGVVSRMEVQGIEALTANFVRPESVWLKGGESKGADTPQTLLRVDTEVWRAVGEGQKALPEKVLEIRQSEDNAGLGKDDSSELAYERSEQLRLEQGTKVGTKAKVPGCCKIARALALELLGNRTPICMYTLKQFRDVRDPDKACHQAITRVVRELKEVVDLREIEETLTVHFHDFPSLQIVETLGIVAVTPPEAHATGIVYSAQAVRPFYIQGTLDEPLAERLADRTADEGWTIYPPAFQTILSDGADSPVITVDEKAETLQDQVDPCQMSSIMYQAHERLRRTPEERLANGERAISKAQARSALDRVDPQMVIDSVLSREWGNADENSRWREGRMKLLQLFRRLPLGGLTNGEATAKVCHEVNNRLSSRPGSVARQIGAFEPLQPVAGEQLTTPAGAGWEKLIDTIIRSQIQFTYLRNLAEEQYEELSRWEIQGSDPAKYPSEVANSLLVTLETIAALQVIGEPSARNNLDERVMADAFRSNELLQQLRAKFVKTQQILVADVSAEIELARQYCAAQQEALLNKLSRAYQKPDFCISRDSIGTARDRYLPLSLAWDEHWYYGRNITAEELTPASDCIEAVLAPTPVEGDGIAQSILEAANAKSQS